jgi:hypothetical protein
MRKSARELALPQIPEYIVWRGRAMLHARYQGTSASARNQGRPWHVVAASPQELVQKVSRDLVRI